MIRHNLIFIFFIAVIRTAFGQCTLLIHLAGTPTDTIFVANYEEDHQPKRINDSTYKLIWPSAVPERICLVLDRPTRWWTTIWIEPSIKNKEITVDYQKKEMRLINGSEWDVVTSEWMGPFPYHGDPQSDSIAAHYTDKHPDSYLSLFFLSHGLFRENKTRKKDALNSLDPVLKTYPEYKQAIASMNERKYPNIGDAFKEFTLTDKNDTPFNSASITNKWILLNLWTTTCGPCVKELDEFAQFYNSVDKSKVEFISVALDEDKAKWKETKFSEKITWINLWSPDNLYCDLCLNYNMMAMPFFVLFDNEKKIYYIKDGAGELENIKNTLKEKGLLK